MNRRVYFLCSFNRAVLTFLPQNVPQTRKRTFFYKNEQFLKLFSRSISVSILVGKMLLFTRYKRSPQDPKDTNMLKSKKI